jgi:hypothetical protein
MQVYVALALALLGRAFFLYLLPLAALAREEAAE